MSKKDVSWKKIFDDYEIINHNFSETPFLITARQIKDACQDFTETGQKEVRILCKQDSRDDRPQVFIDRNLFLLPIKNGQYFIVEGEGYVDIPEINTPIKTYNSKLDYHLDTSLIHLVFPCVLHKDETQKRHYPEHRQPEVLLYLEVHNYSVVPSCYVYPSTPADISVLH